MTKEADPFKAFRAAKLGRKKRTLDENMLTLQKHGIAFEVLSPDGPILRVGSFHFWPTTGMVLNNLTKKRSRGVRVLLDWLKREHD